MSIYSHDIVLNQPDDIIKSYLSFIDDKHFPCIAAKAALSRQQIYTLVAPDMSSDSADKQILEFLYAFVDEYRLHNDLYHSATVIFRQPSNADEEQFDAMLWQRLQSLSDLDSDNFKYDARVSSDIHSPQFSFSLKEEAFFVIGLHPGSSRLTRQFAYPTLVFNPHQQFEKLREQNHYESMKQTVRKRDLQYSGSINPMLADFGSVSEVLQYSGRKYDNTWQCPLKIKHGKI